MKCGTPLEGVRGGGRKGSARLYTGAKCAQDLWAPEGDTGNTEQRLKKPAGRIREGLTRRGRCTARTLVSQKWWGGLYLAGEIGHHMTEGVFAAWPPGGVHASRSRGLSCRTHQCCGRDGGSTRSSGAHLAAVLARSDFDVQVLDKVFWTAIAEICDGAGRLSLD